MRFSKLCSPVPNTKGLQSAPGAQSNEAALSQERRLTTEAPVSWSLVSP